jgi:hypothetical protein
MCVSEIKRVSGGTPQNVTGATTVYDSGSSTGSGSTGGGSTGSGSGGGGGGSSGGMNICVVAATGGMMVGGAGGGAVSNAFCQATPGQPNGAGSYNSAAGPGPNGTQSLPPSLPPMP